MGRWHIQTLHGQLRLRTAQGIVDLPKGRMVALDSGVYHDLEAIDRERVPPYRCLAKRSRQIAERLGSTRITTAAKCDGLTP